MQFPVALLSFIPGKLETSWIDELTDYADTFLEDEQTRQGNIPVESTLLSASILSISRAY
jgi:hypothetical protein